MICQFCTPKKVELERIPAGILRTYDFDTDGKVFLFCPECFHCDNVNLIEERRIQRSILNNEFLSNRHYRSVIQQLSVRAKDLSEEERKIFVADINRQIKLKRDDEKVAFIASAFNVTAFRVIIMTLTVKRRSYHISYRRRTKTKNWWVTSAKGGQ